MKRLVCVICAIFMVFFIAGCNEDEPHPVSYPKPVIVMPDEHTAYTINGYKDTTSKYSSSDTSSETTSTYEERYVGNKNTKKLHKTVCSYANKLKEENVEIFETVNDAILEGYTACSRCIE